MDLRILLLEDDPDDALLIAGELTRHGLSFDMVRVETMGEFRDAIGSHNPHLILSDYQLPTLTGIQALQVARESCPGVPFILVSGVVGEDVAVESMRRGVTDYVLKQRLPRLGAVIDRALREVRDLSARSELSARVTRQQQQIADIVEHMPAGFFTLDEGFRFTYVNGRAERALNRSRVELLGRGIFDALPETRGTPLEAALQTAARDRLTVDLDYRQEPDSGSYEVQVIPLSQPDRGVAAYLRDVTDRRLAEEGHRRSLDQLHEVDAQRRALLTRLVRAQEDERRRIAVEIHDDCIQAMIAAQLRLEGLSRSSEDADAAGKFAALSDTVRAAVSGLRELVFDLRPVALDRDGLPAALSQYLRYHWSDSDAEWAVADLLTRQPSPDSRIILYRIAQEALANIRKHAGATRIDVEVRTEGQGTGVVIRDDGLGFTPIGNRNPPDHLGLAVMRDRAELASGWLRIDSAPGKGTVVEFWVPDDPQVGGRGD